MLSVRRATVNYLIAGFDYWLFLSTPSARRATLSFPTRPRFLSNFYPRPPRGGRLTPPADRDEGWKFLSTPSARRATCARCAAVSGGHISIHALREEGDIASLACSSVNPSFLSTPSVRRATAGEDNDKKLGDYFYPRPPRGGRRECIVDIDSTTEISIHALREEGDGGNQHGCLDERISIHALREEGDVSGPVLVSTS